jgi:hypothetical protein
MLVMFQAISQLHIGDYVKSGDNEFTFKCMALVILILVRMVHSSKLHFHENNTNDEAVSISPFIEISARHIIVMERNRKQYQVPAGKVRVDDIVSGQCVKLIQEVNPLWCLCTIDTQSV